MVREAEDKDAAILGQARRSGDTLIVLGVSQRCERAHAVRCPWRIRCWKARSMSLLFVINDSTPPRRPRAPQKILKARSILAESRHAARRAVRLIQRPSETRDRHQAGGPRWRERFGAGSAQGRAGSPWRRADRPCVDRETSTAAINSSAHGAHDAGPEQPSTFGAGDHLDVTCGPVALRDRPARCRRRAQRSTLEAATPRRSRLRFVAGRSRQPERRTCAQRPAALSSPDR